MTRNTLSHWFLSGSRNSRRSLHSGAPRLAVTRDSCRNFSIAVWFTNIRHESSLPRPSGSKETSVARYTFPIPPWPSRFSKRYAPRIRGVAARVSKFHLFRVLYSCVVANPARKDTLKRAPVHRGGAACQQQRNRTRNIFQEAGVFRAVGSSDHFATAAINASVSLPPGPLAPTNRCAHCVEIFIHLGQLFSSPTRSRPASWAPSGQAFAPVELICLWPANQLSANRRAPRPPRDRRFLGLAHQQGADSHGVLPPRESRHWRTPPRHLRRDGLIHDLSKQPPRIIFLAKDSAIQPRYPRVPLLVCQASQSRNRDVYCPACFQDPKRRLVSMKYKSTASNPAAIIGLARRERRAMAYCKPPRTMTPHGTRAPQNRICKEKRKMSVRGWALEWRSGTPRVGHHRMSLNAADSNILGR